jgi:hypothetical protein
MKAHKWGHGADPEALILTLEPKKGSYNSHAALVASPGTPEDHHEAMVACPKKPSEKLSNG